MKTKKSLQPGDEMICICNQISRHEIENAIQRGCNNLKKVSNATTAGAGQCGGSCKPKLEELIALNCENVKKSK